MRLLNKQLLRDFTEQHAEARSQIESWEAEVDGSQWGNPHELKQRYPKASILNGRDVIFNICRNKYRLWVQVSYKSSVVLIKKIGTHKEYEKWNIG